MAKFTTALAFLLATCIDARINTAEVSKAAKEAVKTSPVLRLKELENRRKLESKVMAAAKPVGRSLEEGNGNDDNQNMYNYWDEWNADMTLEEYGFCINEYSVKYTGCHTAQSYSDTIAGDDTVDGVLMNQGFATFRLCPSDQCSSNSKYGCSSNYGEYVVPISTYLAGLIASEEERVRVFCEYCNQCTGIQSAKQFISEIGGRRSSIVAQADASMENWIIQYQAQQVANGAGYYNGNGNYVAYGDDEYATAYWQVLRSNSNYANNYQNGNYNSQYANNNNNNNNNYSNQNQYQNQQGSQWWQDEGNMEQFWSASYQQTNEENWNNMGTWFGRPILNGYFGDDGLFYEGWGYFSSYDGEFHLLSEEEAIFYDPALFGDMPSNWDENMFQVEDDEGNEVELSACSYSDMSSCSGQYTACMQILDDEDYNEYMMETYGENYAERMSTADFLQCAPLDENGYAMNANEYAQDQAYQQYQANKQYQQQGYGEYYECEEGNDACEQQQEYNEQMKEYQQQQYQENMNKQYFIGPRCAADGHSIQLAVFSDEYCSSYEEGKSVVNMIGYNPMEDSSGLFPKECISCKRDMESIQQWYGQTSEEQQEQMQEQGQVSTMCSMLFQVAGKCHRNLNPQCSQNWNTNMYYQNQGQYDENVECEGEECDQDMDGGQYQQQSEQDFDMMFQSQQQAANEEAVCNYVDTLQSGAYNENGEIYLGKDAWASGWSNPANWQQEFNLERQAMSSSRKVGLSIFGLAVAGMACYACFLHGALARKNIPWRPRRTKGEDPMDVVRQNSGIVMGRSRSGPANAPLI